MDGLASTGRLDLGAAGAGASSDDGSSDASSSSPTARSSAAAAASQVRAAELLKKAQESFVSARVSDAEISATMRQVKAEYGYDVCPHTACGVHAALRLLLPLRDRDHHPSAVSAFGGVVCLATAHPGKFDGYDDGSGGAVVAGTDADAVSNGSGNGNGNGSIFFNNGADGPPVLSPPLPPQLRGLLKLPRRVSKVPNSQEAVKRLMQEKLGLVRSAYWGSGWLAAGGTSPGRGGGGGGQQQRQAATVSVVTAFLCGAAVAAAVAAVAVSWATSKEKKK
jgi:threonine synthase